MHSVEQPEVISAVFPLKNGQITLTWPKVIEKEEIVEFIRWLSLMTKKFKKQVERPVDPPSESKTD